MPTESFKSPVEASEFYLDRLEKAGAKQTRTVEVELMSYRPRSFSTLVDSTPLIVVLSPLLVAPNSKTVHLLTHSEYPASCFAIAEQSNCSMLVADESFVRLMNQMKALNAFTTSQSNMIARGLRLEYKDFIINLSTVTQSQTAKGVILEVNFLRED